MQDEKQNAEAVAQDAIFKKVNEKYTEFFSQIEKDSQKGTILVNGERYVMYRAQSMSVFLRKELEKILGTGVHQAVYRFGRACGSADASFFIEKFNITDSMEKGMTGPIYFAHGGYATVEILPESNLAMDENFLLIYNHPNSYEAEAFIEAGTKTDRPICHLNAGYSSGWATEAFGFRLEAKEITCRAHGDEFCKFVMAPPRHLNDHIAKVKELYNI
ncbi:hypothetical protein GF337_20315 [candidate division KSB1 bacterium]|nr:hypothetical protein [candidate division KSB1 bacterium]